MTEPKDMRVYLDDVVENVRWPSGSPMINQGELPAVEGRGEAPAARQPRG